MSRPPTQARIKPVLGSMTSMLTCGCRPCALDQVKAPVSAAASFLISGLGSLRASLCWRCKIPFSWVKISKAARSAARCRSRLRVVLMVSPLVWIIFEASARLILLCSTRMSSAWVITWSTKYMAKAVSPGCVRGVTRLMGAARAASLSASVMRPCRKSCASTMPCLRRAGAISAARGRQAFGDGKRPTNILLSAKVKSLTSFPKYCCAAA